MTVEIVYLVTQRVTERNRERFGLNYFSQAGYKITIIDITDLVRPKDYCKFQSRSLISNNIDYFCISDYLSFLQAFYRLRELRQANKIFLFYQFMDIYQFLLLFFFKNRTDKSIFVTGSCLPSFKSFTGFTSLSLKQRLYRVLNPLFLVNYVLRKFYLYDFCVSSSLKASTIIKSKNIIPTYSFDYSSYLKITSEKNLISSVSEPYCVFLDEAMINHPDYLATPSRPHISRSEYITLMSNFFARHKSISNMKMVVALHPRSSYSTSDIQSIFPNTITFKGNTENLVAKASYVYCHSSTSVSFAVLFRKPLIFLTSNTISQLPEGSLLRSMAKELSCSVINLDNIDLSLIKKHSSSLKHKQEPLYDNYIDNYLKHPLSSNSSCWKSIEQRAVFS